MTKNELEKKRRDWKFKNSKTTIGAPAQSRTEEEEYKGQKGEEGRRERNGRSRGARKTII